MNPSSPVVSVCLAVYNAEIYVAKAIDSILQQTFTDFELLIVDDGSSDRSLDILKAYAAKDSRIVLHHQENQGQPATRNRMLRMAKGELIAVMDADDIALPDRLENQVAFLQTHPAVVWVGGAFDIMDDRGRFLTTMRMAEANEQIQTLLKDGHTSFLHPTAMIRKTALQQVGGYDERYVTAADLDLWLKMTEIGDVANLPQSVIKYRVHAKSISQRNQEQQWQNAAQAFDESWQRRGLTRTFEVTGCRLRPLPTKDSQLEYLLKYGWWAFNSHQRRTAAHYGIQAIATQPRALDAWKLLICALIKPLPIQTLP